MSNNIPYRWRRTEVEDKRRKSVEVSDTETTDEGIKWMTSADGRRKT